MRNDVIGGGILGLRNAIQKSQTKWQSDVINSLEGKEK